MSDSIINVNSNEGQYVSSRLRCHYCRRNGHSVQYEQYCYTRLLSRVYTCIENETDHEKICFKIIRTFSIDEIHNLFKAIHDERNIGCPPIWQSSFINLVPTIASILLEQDESMQEELEIEFQAMNTDTDTEENIVLEQEDHTEREIYNPETPTPYLNQYDEDGEEPIFPPPAPIRPFQDLSYNVLYADSDASQFNDLMVENEMDISEMPPLMDLSGNIVFDDFHTRNTINNINAINNTINNAINNAINNNQNENNDIELRPIQIILNQSIEIIPNKDCPITDESTCPVCYEDFKDKNTIKTECGHCFCFDCVKKFTKINRKCPMCRVHILKLNVNVENLI